MAWMLLYLNIQDLIWKYLKIKNL